MKLIIALLLLILIVPPVLAERYEYISEPNIMIPDSDSTGIRDTIFIPDHILIEDINFYVGVGDEDSPWAEEVLIDVFSPQRVRVKINDCGPITFDRYNVWYDTDRPVDGPGLLQDYNGGDAYGPWEMFCFDPFYEYTLFWYSWRIEVIGSPIQGIEEESSIPRKFALGEIYPNPFYAATKIKYSLPIESHVTLDIFDLLGRKVETIRDAIQPAGYYQINWKAGNAPSGVYFVKLKAGEFLQTKKMVLLK